MSRSEEDMIELYQHGSGEDQEPTSSISFQYSRQRSNNFQSRNASLHREDSRSFVPLNEDDSGSVRLEQHAAEIVRRMEEDDTLMEDNPISEHLRMETLRDMPQCLTLKRSIKARLTKSVSKKSKRRPLGFFKRCKYQISMTFEKFRAAAKNIIYSFELWYSSLKAIEGHFGSGVATYFKFLRWIFVMNFLISIPSFLFLFLPQVIYQSFEQSPVQAKQIQLYDENNQTILVSHIHSTKNVDFSVADIITGEGYLTYTTLFYGYYTNESISLISGTTYSLPYAYFFTMFCSYVVSFFVLSISMARSYRRSFIETSGGLKNVYAHKIFCGWDFGIATKEGAELKSKAIYNELKELLSDENQESDLMSVMFKFWTKVIQIVVHLFTFLLLGGIAYLMWTLLQKHRTTSEDNSNLGSASVITAFVVTIIMTFGPLFLTWIIKFEDYKNPRTALYISLMRTFLLEIVVIGVLITFWLNNKSGKEHCWETSLGQEVYRLILIDFIISVVFTALVEFVRVLIYKYVWHKIGMSEFDIASNTLQIIYNQTLFWVGFYFSPLLSIVVTVKFWCTWYLKRLSCLHLCKPSSKPWRAAQTQTLFQVTTFLALFAVVIVHGYIFTQKRTSKCGPFQSYDYMYEMVLKGLLQIQKDHGFMKFLVYLTKPGVIMGLLIIMSVRVYYLHAKSTAQRSMVQLLREMLVIEAKDKEFLLTNISKITEGKWIYNLDRRTQGRNSNRTSNRSTEPSNTWQYQEQDIIRRLPRYNFNNISVVNDRYNESNYDEDNREVRPRRNRM